MAQILHKSICNIIISLIKEVRIADKNKKITKGQGWIDSALKSKEKLNKEKKLMSKVPSILSNRALCFLLALAMAVFFISPDLTFSQVTTGSLSGAIVNEQGERVEAAALTIRKAGTINYFTAISDEKGRYLFPNLSPGIYTMTVDAVGYHRLTQEVTVKVGGKISLHPKLTKVVDIREEILVTAEAPLVETTKTSIDQNISFEQFQNIPTQGRDFNSIINTFAGVNRFNNNFNVLGSRDNQNNFLIDGMKNNELGDSTTSWTGGYARSLYGYAPQRPENEAGEYVQSLPGSALQKLNLDSIEEIQVSKTGYSAEYGQGSGAVFNIVTRSGTDKFKFGFTVSHQTHTVNDWFQSEENKSPYPMKRWQESVFLGGPIIQGKLRFFVTYERDDHFVGFDDRLLTVARLNLWVKELDIWESEQGSNRVTGKLTFIESEKSKYNLTLNYNNDASGYNLTLYKAPGDLDHRTGTNRGFSLLLNNQRQFESGLLNISAKYAHLNRFTNREAGRDNLELRPTGPYDFGFWIRRWGGYGNDVDISINSFQVKTTYNWFLKDKGGDHNILIGVDYENYKQHSIIDGWNYVAFINRNRDVIYGPSESKPWYLWFSQSYSGVDYDLPLSQASFFINEEWRINPNLTLTAGFRTDWDEFIDKIFVSPRIGFAWDPFGDGKTVIRGGGGVFRDRSDLLAFAKHLFEPTFTRYYTDGGPFAGDPADMATWEDYLDTESSSGQASSNFFVADDFQPPMTWEVNIGFERDLVSGFVFRANYIYKKMTKLFYEKRENYYSVFENGVWSRPDPTKGTQFTLMNAGYMAAHDIEFILTKSFRSGSFFNLSYVWEETVGNSHRSLAYWFETYFNQVATQPQWSEFNAPASFEVKHFLKASWSFVLPLDFLFSGFLQLRTGKPFHVFRTDYPAEGYQHGWVLVEPPNSRTMPSFSTMDVRFSKRIRVGSNRFQIYADVFNLLNRENVLGVEGNKGYANFLDPINFGRPRQIQIGFKWEFN